MELDPRVKSAALRYLPSWVVARLDPVAHHLEQAVAEFARRRQPGETILDAGCGENRFRALFARCRCWGYDRGIGDARWDYGRIDIRGALEALAVRPAALDGAICLVVLEHLPHPDRFLAELSRALKPGGELLLAVPLLWEVHQRPHDYFRFTRPGIALLLEEAGFEIVRCEPMGGFFTLMARRSVNCLSFFQGSWKWPLFVLLAPWLGLVLPLLLPALDRLDSNRDFTLGYEVLARRQGIRPSGLASSARL